MSFPGIEGTKSPCSPVLHTLSSVSSVSPALLPQKGSGCQHSSSHNGWKGEGDSVTSRYLSGPCLLPLPLFQVDIDSSRYLQSALWFLSCKEIFFSPSLVCAEVVDSFWFDGSRKGDQEKLLHMGKTFTSKILR